MIEIVDRWNGAFGALALSVVVIDPDRPLPEGEILWLTGRSPALRAGGQSGVYSSLAERHGRFAVDRWLRYYEARWIRLHPAVESQLWIRMGWVGVSDRVTKLPKPLAGYHGRGSKRNNYTPVDDCFVVLGPSVTVLPDGLPCLPAGADLRDAAVLDAVYARCRDEAT